MTDRDFLTIPGSSSGGSGGGGSSSKKKDENGESNKHVEHSLNNNLQGHAALVHQHQQQQGIENQGQGHHMPSSIALPHHQQATQLSWTCELCGRMFSNRDEWSLHAKSHLEVFYFSQPS